MTVSASQMHPSAFLTPVPGLRVKKPHGEQTLQAKGAAGFFPRVPKHRGP